LLSGRSQPPMRNRAKRVVSGIDHHRCDLAGNLI
jgi:hypothetical protein